ncbi:hypothetical protein E2C01_053142 [Portunus trituberculatus]|uniref:Uncharacterized protein n=1 Tax=Portunus trituberculatus TaxID=210409 RepID=A0A5B7GQ06_PORTR|nr:hypothetical protein [Portunus trituberculatus]
MVLKGLMTSNPIQQHLQPPSTTLNDNTITTPATTTNTTDIPVHDLRSRVQHSLSCNIVQSFG